MDITNIHRFSKKPINPRTGQQRLADERLFADRVRRPHFKPANHFWQSKETTRARIPDMPEKKKVEDGILLPDLLHFACPSYIHEGQIFDTPYGAVWCEEIQHKTAYFARCER